MKAYSASILAWLDIALAAAHGSRNWAGLRRQAVEIADIYDYIIIGGGTSGLTVADRLTEDESRTVLVIEYGYLDNSQSVLMPSKNRWDARNVWNITSAPQRELNNRTVPVNVGAVVGGCSAVNSMVFVRGAAEDYDAWSNLGNPGWGWNDLLPYFKKSVSFTPPSPEMVDEFGITYDASAYGNGPIQASYPPFQWPGQKIMWKAWDDLGIKSTRESAAGTAYGRFWNPSSQDPRTQTRSYARTGHYDPVRNRPNYHLLTAHKALKINISASGHADGVLIQSRENKNITQYVRADQEVILAAGALHTPQVLQLSGIGPRSLLEEAGIEVKYDLPGVGQNFQDHHSFFMVWNFTKDLWPNPNTLTTNTTFAAEAAAEYAANKTGPLSWAAGNSAVFLPAQDFYDKYQSVVQQILSQIENPAAYLPKDAHRSVVVGFRDQLYELANAYNSSKSAIWELYFWGGGGSLNNVLKPLSRGTVNIDLDDPWNADPVVNYRTLSNPIDVELVVQMVKSARQYYHTPTMAQLAPVELVPGSNVTSDQQIERYLRGSFLNPTNYHPSGTASMRPLERAGVVDPELLVYGITGLSVVDASIMPMIPSAHLSATVYAVAEKAADLIKARAAKSANHLVRP